MNTDTTVPGEGTTVFVQFADSTRTRVVSVFAGPQDGSTHPHQAELAVDDVRYLAYLNPPELRQAALEGAVQAWLDGQAQAHGFDNIVTAVSYADEPAVLRFQQDGRRLRALRSRVWAHCYTQLDAVKAGQRAVPAAEELIAELEALAT